MLGIMASAPEAIDRFEAEGLFVVSPALTGRRLRERGTDLWPASGKGGGKNSPQVGPQHLRAFLLAQAAHLPVDAAAAVATLLPLQMTEEEVLIQPQPERAAPFMGAIAFFGRMGDTLGHVLHAHIIGSGDPKIRAAMPSAIAADWALTLCVDPAFATVSWRTGNKVETVVFGSRSHTGRSQRLITLPYKAILICGELLEDSIRKNAAQPRAALPVSHAHAKDSLLNKVDSISCVRATSTPQSPRGVHEYDRP
jgi:hypothetical protein